MKTNVHFSIKVKIRSLYKKQYLQVMFHNFSKIFKLCMFCLIFNFNIKNKEKKAFNLDYENISSIHSPI